MVGEKLMNSAGQCLLRFWDVLRMFPSIAGSWEGGCGAQRDGGPARTSPWWWGLREKNWQSLRDDQDHPRPSKTFLGCVHSDLLSLFEALADIACNDCFRSPQSKMTLFFVWSSLLFRAEGLPKPFGWSKTREACWGLFFDGTAKGNDWNWGSRYLKYCHP